MVCEAKNSEGLLYGQAWTSVTAAVHTKIDSSLEQILLSGNNLRQNVFLWGAECHCKSQV